MALEKRYSLSPIDISKRNISTVVRGLESNSSDLSSKNSTGIYSGVKNHERYFWFQDKVKPPPIFPQTCHNISVWDSINEEDSDKLVAYLARISRTRDTSRKAKKRQVDEVDLYDLINDNKKKIKSLASTNIKASSFELQSNFWDSPEARRLFNVKNNTSLLEVIATRCLLLSKASFDDNILLSILHDVKEVSELSSTQIQYLRYSCLYLRKAYENAVQYMNSLSWIQCIENAIKEMHDIGIYHITNEKTVRMLNCTFRCNEKLIPPFLQSKRQPLFLEFYPDFKTEVISFCNKAVSEGNLSTDLLHSHVKSKLLHDLYQKEFKDIDNPPSIVEFLNVYNLNKMSISTIYRWMIYLGYRYDASKKTYYTDGHERPDVVADRDNRFLKEYFNNELFCHRWVHLTESEAIELQKKYPDFPIEHCYKFNAIKNECDIQYREYHMDTHHSLRYLNHKPFDYKLSIRKPNNDRPKIILGQDESTFHQNIFSSRNWKNNKGASCIHPKGEGEILMISGIQSRETGLGLGIYFTEENLKKVNERRNGEKYTSKEDALLINRTELKQPLVDDPLLIFFSSGANKDGYWTSFHAKIQLEDAVDFLSIIFPEYDFTFMYDQSSGHTKMRSDGLLAGNMNLSYGGAVIKMRNTKIMELGPYDSILNIGDAQNMHFSPHDNGPFWMRPIDRIAKKYDKILSYEIVREKTKIELLIELRRAGVDTQKRRFLKPELVELCNQNSITTNVRAPKIKHGWVNKPKGMLQVLYERGWINITKVKSDRSMRYSINGKKNDCDEATGDIKNEYKMYSLKYLLNKCSDFKEEKCDLEHLCSELSFKYGCQCSILFSPKFHCEIAGEGVEYSWGCAKKVYRKNPLKNKRTRGQFVSLVKRCVGYITPLMVNRFSAKARRYMMGYKHKMLENDIDDGEHNIEWSYDYNEKIHKIYKTHRDPSSFDNKFIEIVVKECIGVENNLSKDSLKLEFDKLQS